MQRFTVSCPGSDRIGALHRTVLASLPAHFRVVDAAPADAALLVPGGTVPDGVRVVVAAIPLAQGPALSRLPVVHAWTYVPRLEADPLIAEAAGQPVALICTTVTLPGVEAATLRACFIEQCVLMRMVTGVPLVIRSVQRHGSGFTVAGDCGTAAATIAAVESPLGRATLRLDAVGVAQRLEVAMDADALARPACVELFDIAGGRQSPPMNQHSHRRTWLRVHEMLVGSASDPQSLALPNMSDADRWFA